MDVRARLTRLVVAGLVDSLCLSAAWTVLLLEVVQRHGLGAAGAMSAAMLVGVALSPPVAHRAGELLGGRVLLRLSASTEAVLRVLVAVLVLGAAPLWVAALAVTAMNVLAWTGYAGMRAEVAALGTGGAGLTTYGTVVAAVEAVGVAVGALLPVTGPHRTVVLGVLMACYVLALVPTYQVAGSSRVPAAGRRPAGGPTRPGPSPPVVAGTLLMLLASGPTLLSVALTEHLFGRTAVPLAAVAFTVGSLTAPWVAARLDGRPGPPGAVWWALAAGTIAGWAAAPAGLVWLCLAQLCSGACLTLLEGLLDTSVIRYHPRSATGALATASAGRALGSAAATAATPVVITTAGLPASAGVLTAVLAAGALAAGLTTRPPRIPLARLTGPTVSRCPTP